MVSEVFVWARHPTRGRVRDSAEEILDSLERELTSIESDDEPLVRAGTGRNAVPRIHAGEPSVVRDSAATRALQGVARCEVPDVAPSTEPALPPFPTWVDRDLDDSSSVQSESCLGERDTDDEEVKKWGLLPPPAVVHETREVDSADVVSLSPAQAFSARSDPISPTIPVSSRALRRLVLINNSQDVRSNVPVMDLRMMDT